jgi:hypothetical protein
MCYSGVIMKLLSIIRTIVALLPMLIEAIKAAEAAIPGNGKGEQKLVLVRGMLQAAYEAATDVENTFEEVWPALNKTINTVVASLKAAGLFK